MTSVKFNSNIIKALLAMALTFTPTNVLRAEAQELRQQGESDAVLHYSLGDSGVQSISNWPVAPSERKAIVVALHGFGLHKWAYQALAENFQSAGISTYAMDIRGFGSWSDGDRSHMKFDPVKTLDDVDEVLSDLREENPTTPIFLMGESLGGAMALAEVARHPHLVDGVIASVPASERYKSKRTAFNLVLSNLWGHGAHVNIGSRLVSQATTNPALKNNWLHDANARLTVSTSELLTFSRFMRRNHKNAEQISDTSVLILQGGKDRLVKASGSRRLFNELPTHDKEFVIVDKAEHLILEEGQIDTTTFATIGKWMQRNETNRVIASN